MGMLGWVCKCGFFGGGRGWMYRFGSYGVFFCLSEFFFGVFVVFFVSVFWLGLF